uniref:ATP synthase F0 subunit 8 n=1 Tax=Pyemotes zhonghuajia TaxID=2749944 RepID=A0A8T9JGE0_9ACAR|nr:ATP synthase F0 subunit 8 [Pyemotes zhonghuajia]UOK09673.1 ATP synthase F0 subunit 8 [Pyemotes zhonghuajia]
MPQMSPMNWTLLTLLLILISSIMKTNIKINKKIYSNKYFINKNKMSQW